MTIGQYQKKCFLEYKNDLNLPKNYTYFYGNPINTLVPIEVMTNKYMIVGAYPSAKFYRLNGKNLFPLYDNDSPFSNESYFDGIYTRNVPSGNELNDMLEKIEIKREDCWITDLVKIFLFKQEHIKNYRLLGKNEIQESRSKFIEYGKISLKWLEMEILIARPKVIITLGAEVASIIFNKSKKYITENYLDGNVRSALLNKEVQNIISLPHPGILIQNATWNEKKVVFYMIFKITLVYINSPTGQRLMQFPPFQVTASLIIPPPLGKLRKGRGFRFRN